VAPWWAENSKEAYSSGLAGAAAAFGNYAASKSGQRTGPPVGYPRRKTKHRSVRSCRFTTGAIGVEGDRHHVRLPRLGAIRTHESTRKLARRLEDGRARILSATVRQEACGRWYVSLQAEVARAAGGARRPSVVAGVDLGVSHLAVVADSLGGVRFEPNPQHLEVALSTLRRRSRQMARRRGPVGCDPAAGVKVRGVPSEGWRDARRSLARAHVRVRHLRADAIAKLTSGLAAEYGWVVAEDLNVAGMVRNRRLARCIAGAGFGEIRRQLGYKSAWNGGQLVLADRWYPSSKTCSGCGVVKAKLPLRTWVFRCEACGLVLDRDLNAARNLAALAASMAGVPEWPGPGRVSAEYACGADRKTRRDDPGPTGAGGPAALKQEPGIPHGSKTRTGTRQLAPADACAH
jgi:putative transposase